MTNKENFMRMLHRKSPAWIPCWRDSVIFLPKNAMGDRVFTNGGTGIDWFGVEYVDMVPLPGKEMMDDITEWRDIVKFPDLDAIDWEGISKKDLEGIDRTDKVLWIPIFHGLFERVNCFMGMADGMIGLMEEPEEYKALIEAICDFRIKEIDKVITYYHPDVICMHDDYGMKDNMFMPADLWKYTIKDSLGRINDYCKSRDTTFVIHSCGKIEPLIDEFVDLGITAWDSVNFCNDLEQVYAKHGKEISFTTGLDMLYLNTVNEEETRAHVRKGIDLLGKYGNMTARDDSPTVSTQALDWIADEVRQYGAHYYELHPIPAC